jgi:fluoroacetyl-CoA thioesterase
MGSRLFEVATWDGDRKIGDGAHRRRIVNALEFEKRFGEDG